MKTQALSAAQRSSAAKLLASKVATQLADLLISPKTTLTWLMDAVGAPPALTSLLVPLRESGSMLPQLWLAPWISRTRSRIRAAMLGAGGQGLLYAALGTALWFAPSAAWLGVLIVVAVALASLMRAVSSIANKDVLASAVPKGTRGRIGGLATSVAGAIGLLAAAGASVVSLAATTSVYVSVVLAAAVCFALATALLGWMPEPHAPRRDAPPQQPRTSGLRLLIDDGVFRWFVGVRALLSATALCAPYIVLLATGNHDDPLQTLAGFVAAGGLASALSGWVWGRAADRSARLSMAVGAGIASACIVVALLFDSATRPAPVGLWPSLYFVFSVGYAGVRVGRKTYVLDIATGDVRTQYVAASNTLIAVVLLGLGGLAAALHQLGPHVALVGLGGLGALGGCLCGVLRPPASGPDTEGQAPS